MKHGADLNASTDEGKDVVHLAAEKDFAHLIAYFAEHGVNLSRKNNIQDTPLHLAVDMNAYKSVGLLLALLVRRSRRNNQGRTALHIAAKNNNGRMVRLLLLKGLDKDAKDNNGHTAVELASDAEIKALFKASGILEVFGYRPMLADGVKKNYVPLFSLSIMLICVFLLNSIFLESCKSY